MTPSELDELQRELTQARARERELGDTRRAVLNLLEDLDDDRQRLMRAEHEWRAAFDGIRDAIFMHDAQGRVTRANRAYLALAHKTEAEARGHFYWEVFPIRDRPLPGCPEQEPEDHEIQVAGQVFRSRAYVTQSDGEYLFSLHILEDITERRRSELALRQRSEELARANQALTKAIEDLTTAERVLIQTERLAAIGTLASGVAHELNNPLTGIMNYVDYAKRKCTTPRATEALAKATHELQRIEGFVRNLLVLGRPSGEVLVPVSVREALHRAIDLLAADLRKSHIELHDNVPDDLPPVWGGLAPLQQVFLNLLLNAADAMADADRRQLHIDACERDDRVRVTVSDTGRGVPPDAQPHLFEPFFSTKPAGQGTGLGLPTSQNIMLSFGGSLDFEPQGGPGATFMLSFRVVKMG